MTWFAMRTAMLGIAAFLSTPTFAQFSPAPEGATGRAATRPAVEARRFMVAAANPLAASAGRDILRAGGSATDAAIAVQLVLNVVEPQSSGIGGGAFFIHYEAANRRVTTLDGRETAPAAARAERFLGPDGRPRPFQDVVVGGLSVGIPGAVRLMAEAHRRHGRLPWARLFEPAIRLATDGFAMSPRLAGLLAQERRLVEDGIAREVFHDDQERPLRQGARVVQPRLAATFRAIAERGPDAFYTGEIARGIVDMVRGHPTNPGDITMADLAGYRVVAREPVCGRYRGHRICGMGPPSSGAIAIQQMLGILERVDLGRAPGADGAHWLSEAGRLAFADRNLYVADPAFVDVPVSGLIDPAYLATRAALLSPTRSIGQASAGTPATRRGQLFAPSDGHETGTSHISIIDAAGNAVSMTTTIEAGFGARLMAPGGFLLNNQLTDFSFAPSENGRPVANRVEPGKRPRSSMAPTLIFDPEGRLLAVVGSPGGSLIIGYVAKVVVALIDWRMDPQAAIDLANFGSRNGPTELERGTEAEAWRAALEDRGHRVSLIEMTSGAQAIVRRPGGFIGGADTRREGVAIGD